MAYQHYQGPGMAGAPASRDFLWQVFQRYWFMLYPTVSHLDLNIEMLHVAYIHTTCIDCDANCSIDTGNLQ